MGFLHERSTEELEAERERLDEQVRLLNDDLRDINDRRAARIAQREDQERTAQAFDRIQTLIRQWADVRPPMNAPPPTPFPADGDNFTTLSDDKVVEFGKRPKPEPDGAA